MNWRTILNTNLETEPLAHNPHNPQNPALESNCADIADIAHRGTDLKTDKSTHALLSEIFTAGGLLLLDNGLPTGRHIPPELLPAMREHKPVILEWLLSVYDLAPGITPELVRLIWLDAFNPAVLGDQEERIAHVQWWADLARDHPGMVMKACTETPAYLWYLSKPKEPTQ